MSGCCFYITVLPHVVVVVVCELFSTKSGRGILPLTAPIPACLNIKLCSRAFFSPGTWMRKLCSGTCLRAELLCRYLLVFALFYSILYTAQTPWECRHYSFSKVLWLFAYKDIWLVLFFFFCFAQHSPFVSLCKVCDMQWVQYTNMLSLVCVWSICLSVCLSVSIYRVFAIRKERNCAYCMKIKRAEKYYIRSLAIWNYFSYIPKWGKCTDVLWK